MSYIEIIPLSEAKLMHPKDNSEIRLFGIDFYIGTEKLFMKQASEKTLIAKQSLQEIIIDKFVIAKTEYKSKSFSIDEVYNLEAILCMKNNMGVIEVFRLKIPNIRLQFMETNIINHKYYIESDDEYITYKKLMFGTSNISINKIDGEIVL